MLKKLKYPKLIWKNTQFNSSKELILHLQQLSINSKNRYLKIVIFYVPVTINFFTPTKIISGNRDQDKQQTKRI